ncbi:hypothetical protein HZS_4930 [Henneguya salminicola]|nr:hypothetical protein HZS_4930 [Henneguya salminicola]
MEKYLFSFQHLGNVIFLDEAPTFTLIPPLSQFLKFSNKRKTEIMNRRVWRMSEKLLKSHVKLPCKTSTNSFMFCNQSTLLTGCFLTLCNGYGLAFKGVGNQYYTEIMKQRDQSLRCLQL